MAGSNGRRTGGDGGVSELELRYAGDVPTRRGARGYLQLASLWGVWVAIAVLAVVAAIVAPEFFTSSNLQDVLRRASILGIVTMGQVLVLLTGGLDLSVGAMIGVTAVSSASTDSLAILTARTGSPLPQCGGGTRPASVVRPPGSRPSALRWR
jgi:hypothetical protein